jgi:hypothetical protein
MIMSSRSKKPNEIKPPPKQHAKGEGKEKSTKGTKTTRKYELWP